MQYRSWAIVPMALACLCVGVLGVGCSLEPNLGDAPFFCNNGTPQCPNGYVCMSTGGGQPVCMAESSPRVLGAEADAGEADAAADQALPDMTRDAGAPDAPPAPDLTHDAQPPDTLAADTLAADTLAADTFDPCAGVVCNNPPDDECEDSWTARHYQSSGTCSNGQCSYAYTDEYCFDWCTFGECEEMGGGK